MSAAFGWTGRVIAGLVVRAVCSHLTRCCLVANISCVAHKQTSDDEEAYCARFHYAIELIGRRWTGAILVALRGGRSRYTEIRDAIPGLSDHLLCDRLRELEARGLVQREVTPTTPVQIRYRLTAMGDGLGPVLDALSSWASQWLEVDPGM